MVSMKIWSRLMVLWQVSYHWDDQNTKTFLHYILGPTHAMAIYLEMFHHYADRFVTGTDFVSSFGPKEQYPGTKPGNGCVKDKKNHARQVTDTSTFAMFLNDEAFQKIVLGSNYFRINRLQHTFTPPPVCGDSVSIYIYCKVTH